MSEFIIRPCRPSDAEGIHALRVMEGVRENILALPSERLGFCEAYLNGLGPDDHQFAAAVPLPGGGEKIVGTAGLQVYPGRMRHSAGFGIMVHRDWQGTGSVRNGFSMNRSTRSLRGLQRYRPVAASVLPSSSWSVPESLWKPDWKSCKPRGEKTMW